MSRAAAFLVFTRFSTGKEHRPSNKDPGQMNEEQRKEIRVLREAVNMSPSELEEWLETDESKSVGVPDDGETVGHGPRRILDTKSKTVELTDGDREHMREVVGDVHRHLAQRPDGDVTETNWRYSLMN